MTETMAGRLARIMGDVGRVEKKGKITSQGSGPTYKFARDSDVLEAVNPKLAEAGCVLIPEHTELLSMTENMRGTQIIANIKTSWHITDGKESLRFETLGQGQDSGDKALPKAQSNARKYAFFMLFHIVTGDDPDQHPSDQPEREPARRRGPAHDAASYPAEGPPAPVPTLRPRTAEENALLEELLAIPGMTNARMALLADAVEVEPNTRANADQLREMIARAVIPPPLPSESAHSDGAAATPPAEVSASAAATTGDSEDPDLPSESSASPTLDDVLAVTGGEDITPPPAPNTPAYGALSAPEKAKARAYWANVPKAEQLKVGA